MKSLISAVVVATVLAAPIAAFAQSNQPVTRAQVRAELVQLEKAGYNPAADRYDYPVNIQAAQARVNAQNGAMGMAVLKNTEDALQKVDDARKAKQLNDATQNSDKPKL